MFILRAKEDEKKKRDMEKQKIGEEKVRTLLLPNTLLSLTSQLWIVFQKRKLEKQQEALKSFVVFTPNSKKTVSSSIDTINVSRSPTLMLTNCR